MIHHISIPAKNPCHVARVLTELFDNNYCAAFAGDEHGTLIEAIAKREQWRWVRYSRGYFEVVEFWLKNNVLLELATPELAKHFAQNL